MYIEPNTWLTWTMICLNGDIFRDTYLECRSPHIHYYQACSGSLVQHLDLDLSARNWRKDRYTCTSTINNYYIKGDIIRWLVAFLAALEEYKFFVMRECKTTCDAHYFLSQMAVTALRRYKRWIFRKKNISQTPKISYFCE